MVYKLDKFREDAHVEPFELEVGDGKTLTIAPPDGEALITLDETPGSETRKILRLLCGDQYDALWAVIGKEEGAVTQAVILSMISHFGIGKMQAAPGGSVASLSS